MTRFEYINKNLLTPEGIKDQIKLGFLSTTIYWHFSIYSRFDFYRKQKHNITTSVFYVTEDFKISERSVYRILTNMQEEI